LAQGRIFHELKELDPSLKLGTVFNPSVTYSATSKPEDIQAAEYAFGYHTSMFTDPTYLGKYPEYMLDLFGNLMPEGYEKDLEEIKIGSGLSTFGVNYYRGKIIESDPSSDVKFKEVRFPQGITNGLGWPVHVAPTYPDAFYDLLTELYHRYGSYGMKAISITENGTCWDDSVNSEGEVDDEFRIFYVREHLRQVQKAILAGIPVTGYFLWTLMDNYEWELGYKQGSNFGIVHVDRDTMKRTPKKSYTWYQKVISQRELI
jgi:beta-glucosidase